MREDGGLEGNNGALGVGNERTELVVAIEEGGDELLIVEGVEGDAPPIHFNGDSVGIVQGQISHVGDETFTGFLDLRSEHNANSIARHQACAQSEDSELSNDDHSFFYFLFSSVCEMSYVPVTCVACQRLWRRRSSPPSIQQALTQLLYKKGCR